MLTKFIQYIQTLVDGNQLRYSNRFSIIAACILIGMMGGCKKFVEIDPPKTDLIKATVFKSDGTAKAAIASLYAQLVGSYASGTAGSITFISGLSSDELQNYNTTQAYTEFAGNQLTATNTQNTALWTQLYQTIFRCNSILEGLSKSTGVTPALNTQLQGEAKFIRAFAHFYLLNMYGAIPLVLTTDYRTNAVIPRTPTADVYQQIIADLKDAQGMLAPDYSFSNGERTRVNSFTASALLARVYLYKGEWSNAETQSTVVINKTDLYNLQPADIAFLKNSKEAIWQLIRDAGNTNDALTFYIAPAATTPTNAALPNSWVQSFDPTDNRRINWIAAITSGANTYYYPVKYKNTAQAPITEYSTVFRLAEQLLIRAEARAMQNKLVGDNSAATDINAIRSRAGLTGTAATTQQQLLNVIENERRFELFTEWGHRWFDLKRWPSKLTPENTGLSLVDDILKPLKPNWAKEDKLYPIPQEQILNDPAMAKAQNPGYN